MSGAHNCSQLCENTVPGYTCRCATGFTKAPDGSNCIGISSFSVVFGSAQLIEENYYKELSTSCRVHLHSTGKKFGINF